MINNLTEADKLNEELFYNNLDNLYISSSSLKILIESPKKYYEYYVLNKKEQKIGKHFDEGSLVHCMVLEPEELKNKFINIGLTVPSDNIKECINYIFKNKDINTIDPDLNKHTELILAYLKEINLYQSFASDKKTPFITGDEKRVKKIINESSVDYFKILCTSADKKIVDAETWDKCLAKAAAILNNPDAKYLLTSEVNQDVACELELEEKDPNFKYGLKGIIDVIKVNRVNKTVYISDIKTTNSSLKEFKKSFDKYEYWLQAAIYSRLGKLLNKSNVDYKIIFSFIVVDCNNDVYCFEVLQDTMKTLEEDLIKLINVKFHYHIINKDFNLPYDFANKLVYL